MRIATTGIAALITCILLFTGFTTDEKKELMQKKLEHAQALLKYLALEDFSRTKSEAEKLQKAVEDAGWTVNGSKTADYEKEFIRVLKDLQKSAGDKNASGSFYNYLRLSSICFSCHQNIRVKSKPQEM